MLAQDQETVRAPALGLAKEPGRERVRDLASGPAKVYRLPVAALGNLHRRHSRQRPTRKEHSNAEVFPFPTPFPGARHQTAATKASYS